MCIRDRVDAVRIATYVGLVLLAGESIELPEDSISLVVTGILAAFTGVLIGKRWLHKVKMRWIQRLAGIVLILIALALATGLI